MDNGLLKKRIEIKEKFKWDLGDIYKSKDTREADYKKANLLIVEAEKYKGTLNTTADNLYKALECIFEGQLIVEQLFVYAQMKKDEDNTLGESQALTDRGMSLAIQSESAISFLTPEILSIDKDVLDGFFIEKVELIKYKKLIDDIIRLKKFTLSSSEERLLAMAGEIGQAPSTIYGMLCDADMKFPNIKNDDGADVELTSGRFIPFMESKNREVRKAAFTAFYSKYTELNNTLATTLAFSVKKDIFFSKARGYESALMSSLYPDNVPQSVYDNLIKAVHDALPDLHRYMRLKKKALKLNELHMYDLYTPIVTSVEMPITFGESKELVNKALAPLGGEYLNIMQHGIDKENWIDVQENIGKTSGAYSWGVWGVHPYVLLNWSDTVDGAFTLAHELGHAMHTWYSDNNNPYVTAGYPLILAEVASTCNEAILVDYMLKTIEDKEQKKFILNYYLEQFRGTMFRQVMFAEFEKITHAMAESGQALTNDALCEVYRDLNCKYYGSDMVVDDEIAMEWARIPHFYRAFYVYKYATGFASAIALSRMILNGDKTDRDRYITFLKGGGSDYPLELLKKAGVDLSQPDTVAEALKTFKDTVAQLEELMQD